VAQVRFNDVQQSKTSILTSKYALRERKGKESPSSSVESRHDCYCLKLEISGTSNKYADDRVFKDFDISVRDFPICLLYSRICTLQISDELRRLNSLG
jgi:hypothetical protein